MQILRIEDSSYQIQRVNLNNTIYNVQLSFNSRDSGWYLDLFDINLNPILQSKKLQWGSLVSKKYILPQMVGGDLYIFKTQIINEPLGRDNFGEDKLYQLVYLTDVEIEQAVQEYQDFLAQQSQAIATQAVPVNFLTSNEAVFITSDSFIFQVNE